MAPYKDNNIKLNVQSYDLATTSRAKYRNQKKVTFDANFYTPFRPRPILS